VIHVAVPIGFVLTPVLVLIIICWAVLWYARRRLRERQGQSSAASRARGCIAFASGPDEDEKIVRALDFRIARSPVAL
jgi:hypothetical protein